MAVWQLAALAIFLREDGWRDFITYNEIAYLPVGITGSRIDESARTPMGMRKIPNSAKSSNPNCIPRGRPMLSVQEAF